MQLYVHQRTPECKKFGDAVCVDVQKIGLHMNFIELPGVILDQRKCDDFAKADGFSGYSEMILFFEKQYGSLPFFGHCITWRLK